MNEPIKIILSIVGILMVLGGIGSVTFGTYNGIISIFLGFILIIIGGRE